MPNELRKVRIARVALVDKGANQAAHVVLWKRDGIAAAIRKMESMTGEEPAATFEENIAEMEGYQKADEAMSQLWPATDTLRTTIIGIFEKSKGDERKGLLKDAIAEYLAHCKEKLAEIAKKDPAAKEGDESMNEELKKLLEPITAQVTEANNAIKTLKADLDKSKAENEELRKRLAGLKPETQPDTTPVTKAMLDSMDAATRQLVEKSIAESKDLREQVSKLQAEGELNLEAQRISKQYQSITEQDAVGYAKLLLKHPKDSDERKSIEKLLESINAANDETLREYGTSMQKRDRDGDPVLKLENKAVEIRKANPRLTQPQALAEAYRLNPDLAAQIEEER